MLDCNIYGVLPGCSLKLGPPYVEGRERLKEAEYFRLVGGRFSKQGTNSSWVAAKE